VDVEIVICGGSKWFQVNVNMYRGSTLNSTPNCLLSCDGFYASAIMQGHNSVCHLSSHQ